MQKKTSSQSMTQTHDKDFSSPSNYNIFLLEPINQSPKVIQCKLLFIVKEFEGTRPPIKFFALLEIIFLFNRFKTFNS